eukprot:PITA_04407
MAKRSSDPVPSSAWYIDFGASRHFSRRHNRFIDFSPFSDSVVFGEGEEYRVVGKGTVQIQSGGRTLIFLNVYYVPGREINLLYVNQIMRNSPQLDVEFSADKCSIIDKKTSLTVVAGLEDHGLYRVLDTSDSLEVALAARVSPISTLWHQRYGHLNMQYLSQISREGLVSELPDIRTQQLGVCSACQAGKQHRSSFKDGESWRASKQNNVVERRNRTVVEMARSMLQHRSVPNKFWAEAVFTVVYLLNRSPTQAVKGKTPEEVWSGRKPKISHLKVFGSVAYVWIPAAKCSKLGSKSQKLMMTGVLLPVGPPDGRDDATSVLDDTLPALPPEHNPPLAAPIVPEPSPPPPNIGSSTLRPKWWAKTIGDLWDNELLEGRTSKHKSKQQSAVNFALMANLHSIFGPQTYSEAKGTPEWEQAMEAEFQSLQKNHTWTLSDLPAGKKPISCKSVYKVKYKADGTLDKYKAHLVARGFSQKEGIDYETFAPSAKMSTIRLVLALVAQFNWKVH